MLEELTRAAEGLSSPGELLDDIKTEIKNTGRWNWDTFREQLGKEWADPTSFRFAKLETLIKDMSTIKHWEAGDIGPIRRGREALSPVTRRQVDDPRVSPKHPPSNPRPRRPAHGPRRQRPTKKIP